MKTFKDLKSFEKRLKKTLCWEDYFKLKGRLYKIFEYGNLENHQYVYFYNKKSEEMIKIEYIRPSYKYIDGIKTKIRDYKFISLVSENYPINYLWRTDTL